MKWVGCVVNNIRISEYFSRNNACKCTKIWLKTAANKICIMGDDHLDLEDLAESRLEGILLCFNELYLRIFIIVVNVNVRN